MGEKFSIAGFEDVGRVIGQGMQIVLYPWEWPLADSKETETLVRQPQGTRFFYNLMSLEEDPKL